MTTVPGSISSDGLLTCLTGRYCLMKAAYNLLAYSCECLHLRFFFIKMYATGLEFRMASSSVRTVRNTYGRTDSKLRVERRAAFIDWNPLSHKDPKCRGLKWKLIWCLVNNCCRSSLNWLKDSLTRAQTLKMERQNSENTYASWPRRLTNLLSAIGEASQVSTSVCTPQVVRHLNKGPHLFFKTVHFCLIEYRLKQGCCYKA